MVAKHLFIDVDEAIVPFELRTTRVAQKAKDVLVEPVLLLMPNVNGFVIVVPAVQVSQGVEGNVAATRLRSFDVQLPGEGNVCATTVAEKSKIKNKKVLAKALIFKA